MGMEIRELLQRNASAIDINKALKGVEKLELTSTSIGDHGAKLLSEALKENSSLQHLDLSGDDIGDDGARAIAEALKLNSSLQVLHTSEAVLIIVGSQGNSIGVKGAVAFAAALKFTTQLQEFDMSMNKIGDDGAKAIAEALEVNNSLQYLGLMNNSIDTEGGKAIAEALKVNSSLQQLNISSNSLAVDGGRAIAEALKVNNALAVLNLSFNPIGDDGAKAIAEALKANRSLQQLTLGLNSLEHGGRAFAEALKANKSIQQLTLSHSNLGDKGAIAFAEVLKLNSALQKLNIYANNIGVDGARAIAEALRMNNTLQRLDLNNNSIGSDGARAIAEALKGAKLLQYLALNSNGIGNDGAKALVKALKANSTLTELAIVKGNEISSELAQKIAAKVESNNRRSAERSTTASQPPGLRGLLARIGLPSNSTAYTQENVTATASSSDRPSIASARPIQVATVKDPDDEALEAASLRRKVVAIPEAKLGEAEDEARQFIETVLKESLPPGKLIEALRSGVILCRLLNALRPGSVAKVHTSPKLGHHQRENIESYLKACRAVGLNDEYLFETADLYDGKNVPQVLRHVVAMKRHVFADSPLLAAPSSRWVLPSVVDASSSNATVGPPAAAVAPVAAVTSSLSSTEPSIEPRHWIAFSELLFDARPLGAGSFGEVYRVRHAQAGSVYAGKVMRVTDKELDEEAREDFYKEAALLLALRHPHVVHSVGLSRDAQGQLVILCEFMQGGALNVWLYKKPNHAFAPRIRLRLAREIASGIAYLHANKVVHRDLKSDNIFLDEDGMHAKVGDLGLAKVRSVGSVYSLRTAAGTVMCMAPEMLRNEPYGSAVDVYGFALVLFELYTSRRPYTQRQAATESAIRATVVERGERPVMKVEDSVPLGVASLMARCWHGTASQRPRMAEVVAELEQLAAQP